jgi:serine/threonine-protein kinase
MTLVAQPQEALFAPGTVLLERYRIVSALGTGAMGTVYRAEDQVLGQEVALKFLAPACCEGTDGAATLRDEVRIARQVTHPNVCRVHDLAVFDGRPFISMEYVAGEDLRSMLRRIGRLPADKATQVAQQLCSGLYAAHEQGVLHRDLKPANVMLDGEGNVRIADFGIAIRSGGAPDERGLSGTPAYMAPELFHNKGASVQSDLFSLGLVLYEVFTGRRRFRADNLSDLLQQHQQPTQRPSELVPDLDPAVDRAILECLRLDPAQRPASALVVLGHLPGGDPLAASLAAGHTPSPELVAASGGTGRLRPTTAALLLALVAVQLVALALLDGHAKVFYWTALPKSGSVLADRAQEHAAALGFSTEGVRWATGFRLRNDLLEEIRAHDPKPADWKRYLGYQRPTVIDFWYRQVPRPYDLIANNIKGRIRFDDPPPVPPGSLRLGLDPFGRLVELRARPAASSPAASAPARAADWTPLLHAAGLDGAELRPVPPETIPDSFATERAAWVGRLPEPPGLPVRVEAAALDGRPVQFEVRARPWEVSKPPPGPTQRTWRYPANIALIVGSVILVWNSMRRRRLDLKGGFRLWAATFVLVVGFTMLAGQYGSEWSALGGLFFKGLIHGLAAATNLSIYYLALEPHVRRIWPETLISWNRLLSGRVRDPLIGHNVLVGIVLGCFVLMFEELHALFPGWVGKETEGPLFWSPTVADVLRGSTASFGLLLEMAVDMVREVMKLFTSLVLLRLLLRRRWAAGVACAVIWSLVWDYSLVQNLGWIALVRWVLGFLVVAVVVVTLTRWGFLAASVGFVTFGILATVPVRPDLSTWYAGTTVLTLLLIAGAALWGAWAATRRGAEPTAGT